MLACGGEKVAVEAVIRRLSRRISTMAGRVYIRQAFQTLSKWLRCYLSQIGTIKEEASWMISLSITKQSN